ncbi:MAG: alpha/beta fold hydrolase, partial [Actinobacteria bacterium]|nr:alpha/beta fold hydrolase [Actinomycetota bacterium]
MTAGRARAKLPAQLPPKSVDGLDPAWSRLVAATDHSGQDVEWHLLDSYAQRPDVQPRLTLLCVHGNPSWSFLWRSVLVAAPDDLRVIAVDQLDMGFSERTGRPRRLADRVEDLVRLTERLELSGPVVTVAHDWGGPVSLGWALKWNARSDRTLAGVVLTNTAVHQPADSRAPSLIRAARSRPMLKPVTVSSTAFIRGAVDMCRPRPTQAVRDGYLAPYRSADRRHAIADFVADIPLEPDHPTASTLDSIAAGLGDLSSVPVALFWGPNDPVFSDLYLHDFEQRLPHADVHRFAGAHHFVQEEADVAGAIFDWVGHRCFTAEDQPHPQPTPLVHASSEGEANESTGRPMWLALCEAEPLKVAVLELSGSTRHITFGGLCLRVSEFGAGLSGFGIQRGSRVALMIPPGVDLNTALYGCWRAGVVAVVIDSALGPANMTRAIRSANPDHLIAIPKALAAAKVLGWPGRRISTDEIDAICAGGRSPGRGSDVSISADQPAADGANLALLGFTSGSTGPSKGVLYEHRQLEAQRDLLASIYKIEATDSLVAAFAPFALYGPALGITSVVPDMDITKPATLTAPALAEAVAAVDATLVFASPAALANVVATRADLTKIHREALGGVRLLLSAGAPVNPALFAQAQALVPNAEAHTPYGMTEVLPVADVSLVSLAATTG